MPCESIRAAIFRRISNSLAVPFGLIENILSQDAYFGNTRFNKRTDKELSLDQLQQVIGDVDLILTEGYKSADKPKVEVSRAQVSKELLCAEEELLALVTDQRFNIDVPHFGLEDTVGLVDFLVEKILRQKGQAERG